MSEKDSYEYLGKLAPGPWALTLKTVRGRIAHGDTPYLEFELVNEDPRDFELLIDFDGTLRKIRKDDENIITLSGMNDVVSGLDARSRSVAEGDCRTDQSAPNKKSGA